MELQVGKPSIDYALRVSSIFWREFLGYRSLMTRDGIHRPKHYAFVCRLRLLLSVGHKILLMMDGGLALLLIVLAFVHMHHFQSAS